MYYTIFRLGKGTKTPKGAASPTWAKDLRSQNTLLKNEVKNLKHQLRTQQEQIKDERKTLTLAMGEKVQLQCMLDLANKTKDQLEISLSDVKDKLEASKKQRLDLEEKCAVLTRELDSFTTKYIQQGTESSKDKLALDTFEGWLEEILVTWDIHKEQLAKVNADLKEVTTSAINKIERGCIKSDETRHKSAGTGRSNKGTRFYVSEREKLLDKQDKMMVAIDCELKLLKKNVLRLQREMWQTERQSVSVQSDRLCNVSNLVEGDTVRKDCHEEKKTNECVDEAVID